jgi:Tfp pilus assembly protein PilF
MPKRSAKKAVPAARPARAPVPDWGRQFMPVLLLLAAALWTYGPSLGGKWLMNWDDNFMVVDNGSLRHLSGLWSIWVASPGYDYWPLSSTFLWLEWHVFGPNPLGYHLCNLALHVTSGVLLGLLLSRLGLKWGWLGGLLFVVHPLAVESIAWVSEVKNALSLPLFLLAALNYLTFEEHGDKVAYRKAVLFFLLAMLGKTSVVMLPVVFLLHAWWKRGSITRLDLLRLLPFLAIAVALGCVTIYKQTPSALTILPKPRSPLEVVLTAGQAIYFYLGNFLCPTRLAVIYPRWNLDAPTLLQLALWPLLLLLLALCAVQKSWGRHALLGLGFFILTLLPTLGWVHFTFMKFSWVADHFVYLPMIGLVGLGVAAAERLAAAFSALGQRVVLGAMCGLALGLSLMGRSYAANFADEQSLWEANLRQNPTAIAAYNNLGLVVLNAGNPWKAGDLFRQACAIEPNSFEAHCNLANADIATGNVADAITQLNDAQAIIPRHPATYYNLGTLYLKLGQMAPAIRELETAVNLRPDYPAAQRNLAVALQRTGRNAEAVAHLQAALRDSPNDLNLHFSLGVSLMELGQYSAASGEFQTVLEAAPNSADAQQMLQKARTLEAAGAASPK